MEEFCPDSGRKEPSAFHELCEAELVLSSGQLRERLGAHADPVDDDVRSEMAQRGVRKIDESIAAKLRAAKLALARRR